MRPGKFNIIRFLACVFFSLLLPAFLRGQIYVDNFTDGTISEYGLDGSPPAAPIISSGAVDFVMSGSSFFVLLDSVSGSGIGQYSTSGAPVNTNLVTGILAPYGIAASGSDLFVAFGQGTFADSNTVAEYTMSGGKVSAPLISGFNNPLSIAASGSDIFVASYSSGIVGEYTTSGVPVNANLITGLQGPRNIILSGNELYIANVSAGTVGEYTLGATPGTIDSSTPSLVSGLSKPTAVAVFGSDLFIATSGDKPSGTGFVGEYTTSGATVNADLISGLDGPVGVVVVPEPAFGLTLIAGALLMFSRRPRAR